MKSTLVRTHRRRRTLGAMDGDHGRPHVVLIGGYLTEPLNYRRVRRRLLDRGAGTVTIAPLHVPDWLGAAIVGFGPALMRAGRTIRAARRAAGVPLIVVGHSGGGVVARLAMSAVPLDGRCAAVADDVACLVTLGTPHALGAHHRIGQHRGLDAIRFLDEHTPGAWFAPRTAYLSVGSSRVRPDATARRGPAGRVRHGLIRWILGDRPESGSDGLVPGASAHLDGARQVTFPDVLHGHIGGPWYGDTAIIDRWWPIAVELWRGALEARRV